MDSSIVGYIILGLMGFFILSSMLFGIKRGFGKTTFRLIWLLATGGLLWIFTPTITSWLNNFDISSFGININGPVNKLSDIGVNILNSLNLDEAIAQSESIKTFAENFPTMILNVVVFVLGFWLLKILLYPLWVMFASRFFDKKKRKLKEYKRKVKNLKKRGVPVDDDDMPENLVVTGKNRFAGALVGIVAGLVLCVVTLNPIIGLNSIYQKANANLVTQNEAGEEVPYLPTVIDPETQKYLNSYQGSYAFEVATYTGVEYMSNMLFNSLATVEVSGEKIYLSSEVDNGISLYNKYTALSSFLENTSTCDKDSVSDALSNIKEMLFSLNESKLISTIGNDLLPFFVDKYFANNDDFKLVIQGQDYATLLKQAYKNATAENPLKIDSFMPQLEAVVDIATLLNDNGILVPIIKGEISSAEQVITLLVNNNVNPKTFSSALAENLFKVDLLSGEFPKLLDSTVQMLFESMGIIGFESSQKITTTSLKQDLKDILENVVTYFKLDNKKVNGSFATEEDACNAYGALGKVVDVARQRLLSDSSYQGLLDFVKDMATELLGEELAVGEESKFSAILNSLEDITIEHSWEKELRSIAPLINTVMQVMSEDPTFRLESIFASNYSEDENGPTTRIGVALQKAIDAKSVLITNYNIKEVLSGLIDSLSDTSITEYLNMVVDTKMVEEVATDITLKEYILGQIWTGEKSTGKSEIKNWGNELKYSLDVLRKATTTLSNFDKEALKDPENTSFETLGEAIDKAMEVVDGEKNTHLFVENKILRALINNFLEKNLLAKPGEAESEIDKIMAVEVNPTTRLTVKESVLNNIYNEDNGESNVTSWKTELGKLKSLFATDFATSDLVQMGEMLDNVMGSEIFGEAEVRAVVGYYIDRESATFVNCNEEKENLINLIKNNIPYVTSYEKEILNLTNLMNTVNRTDWEGTIELSAEQKKFSEIGRQFDLLSGKKDDRLESETTTQSNLLTNEVLKEFLKYFIKDSSSSLEDDLKVIVVGNEKYAGICANVDSVTCYQTEFENLIKLVEIAKDSSKTLVEIGRTIDSIKYSSILIPTILNDVVVYYVNKNVPADYNNAKDKIKAKLESTTNPVQIESYEREFGYMAQIKDLASQNPIKLVRKETDPAEAIIAGEVFNNITATPNASVIITKDVIAEVINVVIDKQLATYTTMADDLKEILNTIGSNAVGIVDYEMEFGHLDSMLTDMNSNVIEIDKIGKKLDKAESDNSVLFNKSIIGQLIGYFFDQKMSSYVADTSQYNDIATSIKTKALSVVDLEETVKYESMFAEVISLKAKLDGMQEVTTYEGFQTSATTIGQNLDSIEKMQKIADKKVAKDIATIVFDKLKEVAEIKLPASSDPEHKGGSARVEEIINGEKYHFESYATDNPQGTYSGDKYYEDLMGEIKTALEYIATLVP